MADHTAGLRTSRLNNYRVPFLIYGKDKVAANLVERVASQRDIAPTILDIMGYSIPPSFTGKLIHKNNNPPYFADYYHAGMLGWIEDDLLVEIPVSDSKKITCFDYKSDKIQDKEVTCPEHSINAVNRSLSFTSKQQSLMFSGKLSDFQN